MTDDITEIREALLNANANQESITLEISELIRLLLRGITSSNPRSIAHDVVDKIAYLVQLITRCKEFDERRAIADAMSSISKASDPSPIGEALSEISHAALRYFVETGASGNFSAARARKRRTELIAAIDWFTELRKR